MLKKMKLKIEVSHFTSKNKSKTIEIGQTLNLTPKLQVQRADMHKCSKS